MNKAVNEEEITQQSVLKKNLRMRSEKQYTHRERERGTKSISISQECNSYNLEQPTFTKGYKVTLYSDELRATALYAIYINSLRLGLSKGTV